MKQLLFEDLKVGLKVIDGDGEIGVVRSFKSIKSIVVDFDSGGSGIYCFDCCDDKLYIID